MDSLWRLREGSRPIYFIGGLIERGQPQAAYPWEVSTGRWGGGPPRAKTSLAHSFSKNEFTTKNLSHLCELRGAPDLFAAKSFDR